MSLLKLFTISELLLDDDPILLKRQERIEKAERNRKVAYWLAAAGVVIAVCGLFMI